MGWFSRFFKKTTEEELIREIAVQLPAVLISKEHGHAFVRQMTIEANNVGLPFGSLPYVFKILMEMPSAWPDDMHFKNAMFDGREIMARTGTTPDYGRAVVLPSSKHEDAVDQILQNVATWCEGPLTVMMMKKYDALLKKWVGKVSEATEGEIPKDKAFVWIDMMVQRILPIRPRWIPKNSDLVLRILSRL